MEALADDEVHVWLLRPHDVSGASRAAAEALLSASERARARSFRFERHRLESVLTRALVRVTLSRYAPLAPSDWQFRLGEHGRPLPVQELGVAFNASNHPELVGCAVARHETVGLDLEPLARADDVLAVATTVFAPSELAALDALPPSQRADRALSLWTTKEAYIKARSLGFAAPVKDIAVDFTRAPTLRFPTKFDEPDGWALSLRDVGAFRVAVCVRGAGTAPRITLRWATLAT